MRPSSACILARFPAGGAATTASSSASTCGNGGSGPSPAASPGPPSAAAPPSPAASPGPASPAAATRAAAADSAAGAAAAIAPASPASSSATSDSPDPSATAASSRITAAARATTLWLTPFSAMLTSSSPPLRVHLRRRVVVQVEPRTPSRHSLRLRRCAAVRSRHSNAQRGRAATRTLSPLALTSWGAAAAGALDPLALLEPLDVGLLLHCHLLLLLHHLLLDQRGRHSTRCLVRWLL
mmetsp:Transcript_68422/g.187544  ORF Transcript_68422/g.187544 Transcript_68422/m.187544 type:complete len:239 (+) Transcript_68422:100-816(+)